MGHYMGNSSGGGTIPNMVARRQIDFLKLGSRIRFDKKDLDEAFVPYSSFDSIK